MSRFIHENNTEPSQGDSRVASQFESVHSSSLACALLDGFVVAAAVSLHFMTSLRAALVMTIYFIYLHLFRDFS